MYKFIDTLSLHLKAGNGGAGCRSFRREKYVPMGGPDGGDGGRGGHIIFKSSSKLHSLFELKKSTNRYTAPNGLNGSSRKKYGQAGKDLVLLVPTGTQVYTANNALLIDFKTEHMQHVISSGGKGGRGNTHFSTSSNRAPAYAQPGCPGEDITVQLELRLIADIGLIGLPNAGKSCLLKCLTQANVEIKDYPFTTLSPNLGSLKTYDQERNIADIPGLIKGASLGKGLGSDFLRHIDRTRFLVHLIAANLDPMTCWEQYTIITNELEESPYSLNSKPSIAVLSKCDLVSNTILTKTTALFESYGVTLLPISSFTQHGIQTLKTTLLSLQLP